MGQVNRVTGDLEPLRIMPVHLQNCMGGAIAQRDVMCITVWA